MKKIIEGIKDFVVGAANFVVEQAKAAIKFVKDSPISATIFALTGFRI